jgi:hypothetical protein
MAPRYRCGGCGNVTRFDVVAVRRTRAFHHYTIGGELEVEEEEVLDARIEQVTCRWCNASGATIRVDESSDERGADRGTESAEDLHDQPT